MIGLLILPAACCGGEDDGQAAVASILEQKCLHCHNEIDRQGGLSFQSPAEIVDMGLIDRQHPGASPFLLVLQSQDGRPPVMPQEGEPLSRDEFESLRRWVESGAEWPSGRRLEPPAVDDFDWWSYQPIRRPAVPEIDTHSAEGTWLRTPVDAFIVARLQQRGLTPSAEADRRTLIRRVTYDLTGLPPTPEEVRAFVNDGRPEAYEELVDRLLASPRYGERWARHWLDVVKYADT
ncbi:MAG: DUF1549 domain-containing protein, partial [Planctomycetaceae bacterium]|nr:DUF1549 domain-containing protein [Planctomycetaceae bacterium]